MTCIAIIAIHANGTVPTVMVVTVVYVRLTPSPLIPQRTDTDEAVNAVKTQPAVNTG